MGTGSRAETPSTIYQSTVCRGFTGVAAGGQRLAASIGDERSLGERPCAHWTNRLTRHAQRVGRPRRRFPATRGEEKRWALKPRAHLGIHSIFAPVGSSKRCGPDAVKMARWTQGALCASQASQNCDTVKQAKPTGGDVAFLRFLGPWESRGKPESSINCRAWRLCLLIVFFVHAFPSASKHAWTRSAYCCAVPLVVDEALLFPFFRSHCSPTICFESVTF